MGHRGHRREHDPDLAASQFLARGPLDAEGDGLVGDEFTDDAEGDGEPVTEWLSAGAGILADPVRALERGVRLLMTEARGFAVNRYRIVVRAGGKRDGQDDRDWIQLTKTRHV